MSESPGVGNTRFSDRVLSGLLYPLPHHWISRLTYWLTRLPIGLKNPAIRWFIRHYRVDMSEAEYSDPNHYPTFNAFFTRPLKTGARTIAQAPDMVACPADATVSQAGSIENRRIVQAKGHDFSVLELLGGQHRMAQPFVNGCFATLYLSPRDYHRVHMPLSGRLRSMVYVPGRLFSVAPHTTRAIPRLFARNERVACYFDGEFGPFALVLVGAINVAAIETVWHGLVTPPHRETVAEYNYREKHIDLVKGQEMGRFNMGSTVIVLTGNRLDWDDSVFTGQRVKLGQPLAHLHPPPAA